MNAYETTARAADEARGLQATMEANFGGNIVAPDFLLVTEHDRLLVALQGDTVLTRTNSHGSYKAVHAARAAAVLRPGMGFGLMTEKGIAPAIISPRSTATELHLLYLAGDEVHPSYIGDPQATFTDVQRAALQGSAPYQNRQVGTEAADKSKAVATEPGHGLNGLMALTDKLTRSTLLSGGHDVHGLAGTKTGIMPAYAKPTGTSMGLLSTKDRQLIPQEKIVRSGDPTWLIDHEQFRALSRPLEAFTEADVTPASLVIGLAAVAAKSQLGVDSKRLRGEVLTVMGALS